MKSITPILILLLSATSLAIPTQRGRRTICEGNTSNPTPPAASTGSSNPTNDDTPNTIDPALVPSFGVIPNTNANAQQTGSCDGFAVAANKAVLIPCTCPPSRASFLAALQRNVAAGEVEGNPVEFDNDASDQSAATNRARGTALLVTLQNLNGPGKGCPAASAPNFAVLQTQGQAANKVFVGAGEDD